MSRYFLILFILFLSRSAISNIEDVTICYNKNLNQTIYFFADNHGLKDQTVACAQLDDLIETFQAAELKRSHQFYILIEQSYYYCTPSKTVSVLRSLKTMIEENKFANTSAENIEIRDISSRAHHILDDDLHAFNSKRWARHRTHYQSLCPDDITFQHLIDEYYRHYEILDNFAQSLDTRAKNLFEKHLRESKEAFSRIEARATTLKSDHNQTISDFAKHLHQCEEAGVETDRPELAWAVSESFSILLELTITKRVIELSHAKKIMIMAGGWHIDAVAGIMRELGWNTVKFYRITSDADNFDTASFLAKGRLFKRGFFSECLRYFCIEYNRAKYRY